MERRRLGGWPGGVLAAFLERRRGTPAGQPARTPAFRGAKDIYATTSVGGSGDRVVRSGRGARDVRRRRGRGNGRDDAAADGPRAAGGLLRAVEGAEGGRRAAADAGHALLVHQRPERR